MKPHNKISALLRAPKQVPDTEKVKHVFHSLGYKQSVTKVLTNSDTVTVRTNIQELGILDIESIAERLFSSNVDVGFSRNGLIFMFKYD